MFWMLKAFFCSNIKSALQNDSYLLAVKARDAIHGFVCIPMAIKIKGIQLYGHNLWFCMLAYKVENNTIQLGKNSNSKNVQIYPKLYRLTL